MPDDRLDACIRFYTEVLGMRQIDNPAARAWFTFGDREHVHLLEGPAQPSAAHFALQVGDLDAVLATARAHGADPQRQRELWGAPRWYLRDPAGNQIEVFQTPPGE